MGPPTNLLIFIFMLLAFISSSNAAVINKPKAFVIPITRDRATHQYVANIGLGKNPKINSLPLVIHLGTDSLWLNCEEGYTSSTYRPVPCGSANCKLAGGLGCSGCNGPRRPGCNNNTCGSSPYNPFRNLLYSGEYGEDVIQVYSTDGIRYTNSVDLPPMIISCGYAVLLRNLAPGAKGMLGLSKSKISLPAQITSTFNLPNKFAFCLPSRSGNQNGNGDLIIGGGPYVLLPNAISNDATQLLTLTPLVTNPVSTAPVFSQGDPSDEYFIGVSSIQIDGKAVSFNESLLSINKDGVGGTKISTIVRHTTMHTSIYRALVFEFVRKAQLKKIVRVAPVSPFGACFSLKSIGKTKTGLDVPVIDLVLPGRAGNVKWTIYGVNSMVNVNQNVTCLGFRNGGLEPRTSIVIGGRQLEDVFVEFDITRSVFGFTSSLSLYNSSCAHPRRV